MKWAPLAIGAWLAMNGLLAATGVIAFGPLPPRLPLLVAVNLAAVVWLALSGIGERLAKALPLFVLVGFQSFRFPLELILHRAYEEGVMPAQMSYSGRNFDILTGLSALLLAAFASQVPRAFLWAWNFAGLGLLANIVIVALLSMPTPFRVFLDEPANVWIADFPYVWLPTFFVPLALLGHLLLFRSLHR